MEWISVDKELPKFLRKVMFHWVCPGGNRNVSMGYLCEQGWDIYLPYHSFKMCPEKLKVTHWAELPNFPQFEVPARWAGAIIIDDPLADCPTIEESAREGNENARKFAEKFVNRHMDLLKRIADR